MNLMTVELDRQSVTNSQVQHLIASPSRLLFNSQSDLAGFQVLIAPTDIIIIMQTEDQYAAANPANPASPLDPYSLEPPPQPPSPEEEASLRAEALSVHKLYLDLEKNFYEERDFYVVSAKWFRRWQVYVSYEEVKNDLPSGKFIGAGTLPDLNEDIVDKSFQPDIIFDEPYQYLNLALVEKLKSEVDYLLVNKAIWDILKKRPNIEILRKLVETPDGKKVEVYLRRISAIPISNELLKDVEKESIKKFKRINLQLPQYEQLNHLLPLISRKARDSLNAAGLVFRYAQFSEDVIKVWVVQEGMGESKLKEDFLKGCRANRSFSYKMHFPGHYVDLAGNTLSKLEFSPSTLIVFEFKEQKEDWVFFTKQNPLFAKCDFCKTPGTLNVLCSCMYGCYCSRECKNRDKSVHKVRCVMDGESSEEERDERITQHSKKGRMGLRNLGNTCFMNSGIQCITSIQELTDYFFNGTFVQDINTTNPIGTKGELSRAYGKLIRKMWCGTDSSESPSVLKRAIGKFQPMFVGYEQHDSGELITYLLDGLHEDLNRVKEKPYVEGLHHGGRPDPVLAKEGWDNFTKRNQSAIVDLMFGQYKSKLHCPKCHQESITFDPFMTFPLPIPQNNKKPIELIVMKDHIQSIKISMVIEKGLANTVQTMINEVANKLQISNNMIACGGSFYLSEFIDNSREANDIRKEYKHKNIVLRVLEPHEDLEKDEKIIVQHSLCHSQYGNEIYRRNITFQKIYLFKKTTTTKEIHHRLFSYYQSLLPGVTDTEYEQQILRVPAADQKWRVLIVTNSKYESCYFCDQKGCENCPLPYDDNITLGDLMAKIKPSRYEHKFELEIYWRKDAEAADKAFEKVQRVDLGSQAVLGEDAISIYDCFKLAQEPETLDQDNEWYCPTCKDFVLAQKQLTLYKAPKIFIMYFKRFKGKGYKGLQTSKLTSHIHFPVQDLNINEFLVDKSLPAQQNNVDGSMEVQRDVKYDLFAVSNHYGSLGGGHYTAYCKKGEEWAQYDDSGVTVVEPSKVVTSAAYVLFYRRRE